MRSMQRAKEIVKISLGASAVNELLGGGLESRCITEIYGEFRYAMRARQLVHAAVAQLRVKTALKDTAAAPGRARPRSATHSA